MNQPHATGDSKPVQDVTTHQLLIGLHGRMDKHDEDLDEIKRFFRGDSPKGEDGAISRLNAHSNDIDAMKDEQTWQRRGLIVGLIGILLSVAAWGLSKVAEGKPARADTSQGTP